MIDSPTPSLVGFDPTRSTRSDFAKDEIPVSKHPMELAGRHVQYVNSKGGWFHTKRRND
jgi:hypothetical protein